MFRLFMGILFFVVGLCMFLFECYVYKYLYRLLINKQIPLFNGGVINIKNIEEDGIFYLRKGGQEELVTVFKNGIFFKYVITEQAYYVFSIITKKNRKYDNLQCAEKKHAKKFYAIENEADEG